MIKKIYNKIHSRLSSFCSSRNIEHYGYNAVRDKFEDAIMLTGKRKNLVIIDGGAHKGSTVKEFCERTVSSKIYAFEPQPECAAEIKKIYYGNRNVLVIQKALGSERKTTQFNILKRSSSSSIFKPTQINTDLHGNEMNINEVIDVDLIKIDDIINEDEIDIIKLDLQGYELEALKGAYKHLQNTKVIITEVEFIQLYENQPLFADIDFNLRKNGFHFFNFYHLYTFENGQMDAGDAIFVRNDII